MRRTRLDAEDAEFESYQSAVFRELDRLFGASIHFHPAETVPMTLKGLAEATAWAATLPDCPLRRAYEYWLPQFEVSARKAANL